MSEPQAAPEARIRGLLVRRSPSGAHMNAGILDFAQFDVVDFAPMHLLHYGVTLAPGEVRTAVVLIGNYIVDTIAQDA